MIKLTPEQLRDFVIDSGLVPRVDVESLYQEAVAKDQSLGDLLVGAGKITDDDFRRMQAYLLGIPFVDLKKEKIDFATLSIIPEPIARKHNIVAYSKKDGDLEVAMLDPQDLESIEFIHKRSGMRILARLTDKESIKNVLLQYQKSLKAEFGELIEKDAAAIKTVKETEEGEAESDVELKKMAEDVPVVRVVDTLLNHAIIQQASDIHVEPFQDELLIRYRIDGILHDAMVLPKNLAPAITARVKVLANLRLDEKRLPQDGRFKIENSESGLRVSFRVSTLPTYFGEKVVMRLLPETSKGFTLEGLGFHGEAVELIHSATRQTTGMILVTGPTGSGKSTTLYTILDLVNTPKVNISTVEDPVEYQIERVNQTQVKPEIGLTFATGLRSLMRQDPNIIMVGEIRDTETASLAVNAALTGHLVLSTLHTNNAAGAIPRLLDMKAEPFLLVSTINVIIAQRLVRRLAAGAEKYFLTPAELDNLKKHADLERVLVQLKEEKAVGSNDNWESISFYRPMPSAESADGYGGRVVVGEVMRVSRAIRDLVMKNATSEMIEEQAKKEGMLTLIEDGIFQAVKGLTSLEEVLRVINE
jgi:type IV pilus assembly protein PilB